MCKLPVRLLPLVNSDQMVLVDGDYDGEYLSQFQWRLHPSGHVYTSLHRNGRMIAKYLSRLAGGVPPKGYVVLRKNGNKLDNRSCNLYWEKETVLAHTRPLARHQISKSGYRGVTKYVFDGRWRAACAGRHLGIFDTPEEAARAYDEAARARWGDRAVTNF